MSLRKEKQHIQMSLNKLTQVQVTIHEKKRLKWQPIKRFWNNWGKQIKEKRLIRNKKGQKLKKKVDYSSLV